MPIRPSAASFGSSSLGKCCASSHSLMWGRISVSANSRMLRRRSCWSSLRLKSIYESGMYYRLNGRGLAAVPVRMRGLVEHEPSIQQLAVPMRAHAVAAVERDQRPLQLRQPVERHARKVVVFEMIVRIEKGEVPEPVTAHERRPLRRIARVDVVVLPQPVWHERQG